MPGRTICGKRKPFRCVANERDDNTASFVNVAEAEVPEPDVTVDAPLKWIDETRIPVGTQAFNVFTQAKQILLANFGTDVWVERAEIVRQLQGDQQVIKGRLTDVFQQRFNRRVVDETQSGFLMKKQDKLMYFRIN